MQLWANSAVYVHGHSVGETNPALLQALRAGAPTFALDTVFNREVIGASDQLYSHDPESLAGRLTEIFADRSTQTHWSARGKRTIRSRYQWHSVFSADEEALRDAIAHER